MSRIKSKGTKIEKIFAKALKRKGIKYRGNVKNVYGKPDFVLVGTKIAIFCDSAFWHGYKRMKTKRHVFKSNKKFWRDKITRNIARDYEVNRYLKRHGWIVLRFWDFNINRNIDKCMTKVSEAYDMS